MLPKNKIHGKVALLKYNRTTWMSWISRNAHCMKRKFKCEEQTSFGRKVNFIFCFNRLLWQCVRLSRRRGAWLPACCASAGSPPSSSSSPSLPSARSWRSWCASARGGGGRFASPRNEAAKGFRFKAWSLGQGQGAWQSSQQYGANSRSFAMMAQCKKKLDLKCPTALIKLNCTEVKI